MDTTHIACTAEDLISYRLQQAGLLVTKPKFDREGTDLIVFMTVSDGAKFCKVQCKGRSLAKSNTSNIQVFKSYVTDAFVLLLYIDDGFDDRVNLFCFFSDDIKEKWKLKSFKESSKDIYRLNISKSVFNNANKKGNFIEYILNDTKIERLKNIIKNSDSRKEIEQLIDLINKQNQLIKLQKEKTNLETLLNKIEHTDELINLHNEHISTLESIIDNENNDKQ